MDFDTFTSTIRERFPVSTFFDNGCCSALLAAGFLEVESYNPYWEGAGTTFEDLDGYRLVIHKGEWSV